VSDKAAASADLYDIIQSNTDFVNAQFGEYLTEEEVAQDSLRSYYVDYFLGQLNNGGFSQFVYNSRWGRCIEYITDGFVAIGAVRHLALLEHAAEQMAARPGIAGLKKFLASEYFGENEERDILNEYNEAFFALAATEDLIELNARWLRQLPDLVVLSDDGMAEELRRRAEAIPDREKRIAAALAAEPRYMKVIRALCRAAGHELDGVTAGDPAYSHHGQRVMSWHFLTDKGHFHMADVGGKALMFRGHTDEVVCEIEATEELGVG
jgi:hypothetical protein